MNTPKKTAAELTKSARLVKELKAETRDMEKLGLPHNIEQALEGDIDEMYKAWQEEDGSQAAQGFDHVYNTWVANGEQTPALEEAGEETEVSETEVQA